MKSPSQSAKDALEKTRIEDKRICQRQPANRLVAVFVGDPVNPEGIIADDQSRM